MGTRNISICIDKKGAVKIAQYGQWDGYPSGNGKRILEFARNKENLFKLESELESIKFYNECNDIKEFLEDYEKNTPEWSNEPDNRTQEQKIWWATLQSRDVGAKIFETIINYDKSLLPKSHNEKFYLNNEIDFGKDSLMCEWAYCINFQTNKLQCFMGFNQTKENEYKPLFETNQEEVDKHFNYGGARKYYGISLIKEHDLDNLPTVEEFVKELESFEEQ
jgi:hypothetical protein